MTRQTRECPRCTLPQVWLPAENTFAAHFFYGTMSWCAAGKRPTKQEILDRRAGKKGHSVRTVSGGLPEHGRR